ncbi:MAG: hypothetical protein ISR45_09985 [Rhodospirillales bacterium]|nr:hypothetical protein [Rhodospirillales bacterium]
MMIKSEKEQKYIKKMIEVERIKRKRAGLRRKEQIALRAAKQKSIAA